MILLIDNGDSFSYNLYQMMGEINSDVRMIKNSAATLEEAISLSPSHIVLSSGSGRPKVGACGELIGHFKDKRPILGVCQGQHILCEYFGAGIERVKKVMYGKKERVLLKAQSPLFAGLEEAFDAGQYGSFVTKQEGFPAGLTLLAEGELGEIMAVSHRDYPLFGVQFHLGSVLTPDGARIMRNFLAI